MARGLLIVVVVITPVISTAQSLDGVEIQQEDNELRKKKGARKEPVGVFR